MEVTICGKKVTASATGMGGVDWAFTPNWSARIEGLTYLADERRSLTGFTGDSDLQDFVRQNLVAVIRGGINYRFGFGAL